MADILAITARLPVDVATGQGTAPAWSAVTLTEVTQELRTKDENKRAIGVRKVLSVISHGNLGARGEALVARVTELGTDRPDEAIHVLSLLNTLNPLNPPVEAFNIVPALAVGGVAAVALSAALLNPQSQDNMRGAADAVAQSVANSGQSATQQVSTSIEIWKYLFGTAFPVHLLDEENSKLANPIANAQDTNSSSGGYAAGGRPDSLGTTGWSGIAEQGPSGYSRPEEKLPASGVMYQDSADGAKATGGSVELTFDKATRTWTTPAGLDYGQGSVQGNRVLHVLEHAEPNPAKTTNSVFSMDRKEISNVVDEAWLKKGSPLVNDPGAYVVPMGRTIGNLGETSIKIIVRPGTSQVITAYPVK